MEVGAVRETWGEKKRDGCLEKRELEKRNGWEEVMKGGREMEEEEEER
jgi:hypothetical protein